MRIRLAAPGDAEAIRAIYNPEVTAGDHHLRPRAPHAGRAAAWLERHRGAHPAVVAVDGAGTADRWLGFGSLSPVPRPPAYATTVEDSVYVDRDHRGRGVGRALLDELVRLAAEPRLPHRDRPDRRATTRPRSRLHQACGFELVGVEREVGRKHGRWLDVVELQRML